jgi:CelD/BcsL family acetyltransferase involved in cellulose biosynthesis
MATVQPKLEVPAVTGSASAPVVGRGACRDLDRLHQQWAQLTSHSGVPMQDYDWIQAFVETFQTDYEVKFVTVGEPRAGAMAPLCRIRGGGGRFELIGPKQLYERMDFIYRDPASMADLARQLARTRTALFLTRFPADTGSLDAIRDAYRGRGVIFSVPAPDAPWIELDESWYTPEQHLNSGRRSDLRRAARKAKEAGEVSFDILCPPPEDVEGLMDEAYRIEAQGWKAEHTSAMLNDPLRGVFYRKYAAAAAAKGALRMCFMRIGGEAVAMQMAVISGRRFWLLKMGYDERYARCSPGMMLLVETLRYAAGCGLEAYELLGTIEPWTQLWTNRVHKCVSLWIYPFSPQGIRLLLSHCANSLWRSAQGRLGRKRP